MKKKIAAAAILTALLLIAVAYTVITTPAFQERNTLQAVIILVYEDGTESPPFKQPALHLVPLTIQDTTGKTVSSVRLELYATVDYEGTAKGWSFTGNVYWSILDANQNVKYTTGAMPLGPVVGSTAPPLNQAFVVTSSTLTSAQLEALMTGWVSGATYYLQFEIQYPRMEITFVDGATDARTLSALVKGQWQFKYVSSQKIKSLSVSWNPVAYY